MNVVYTSSSDGYLFDKEAILEYYVTKKKTINKQLKEYEKQNKREENEKNELKAAAHRSQVEKFIGWKLNLDYLHLKRYLNVLLYVSD